MVSGRNLHSQTIQTCLAFKQFLSKWREALRDRQTIGRDFWEGRIAYADLQRTGYLARLRLEKKDDCGITPERQLPKICTALKAYIRNMNRVQSLNELHKAYGEWLSKKEWEFEKKAERLVRGYPSLAADLKTIAKRIRRAKRGVELDLAERWKHNRGYTIPIKGHEDVWQDRQLDSQFQVRLGAIFRSFMPRNPLTLDPDARGPALRTVARLIVLFLVCADLAYAKEGQAKLKHNNRLVTVGGVLQQLRAAGIL